MARMHPCLPLWFAGLVFGPAAPTTPWNDSGHRIVSLLAWTRLEPAAQREVERLLRAHPRFAEDLQAGLPRDAAPALAVRHAFALAANWPDTVRSLTHPMHRVANRPTWHYIDLSFAIDGIAVPPKVSSTSPDPDDIVAAIAWNGARLADRDLRAADRAIALCWVVHLVEDLHQPLHACSLRSATFPDGDAGGNRFLVTRSPYDRHSVTNLHALWDSLLGEYRSPTWEACLVTGLASLPEFAPSVLAEAVVVRDPAAWAKESHDLAVRHAYRNGTLQGAVSGETPPPLLPAGYLAEAEAIAMQRAFVAAARLADLLNRTLVTAERR